MHLSSQHFMVFSLKVEWIEAIAKINCLCPKDDRDKKVMTDIFATSEALTATESSLLGRETTEQRRD